MSSNNGGTPPSLEGITAQLQAALEAVRSREAEARLTLSEIEGERKKVEKMLELAHGPVQRPRVKGDGRVRRPGVSGQAALEFREEAKRKMIELASQIEPVVEDVPHSFTYRSFLEAGYDYSEDTLRKLVADLRDEGMLRLVGNRKIGNTTGKASMVFTLVNAQDDREPALVGADVTDG